MTIYEEIEQEIKDAREKFPAFHSQHEAYAVILEELDELRRKAREDVRRMI